MTALGSVDGKNRNAAAGTPEKKNACAIFLCGGSGSRMRGSVADKIFASLAGTPALAFSLRAFEAAGIFARAVFVFRDEAQRRAICALAEKFSPALAESALFCRGGNERKDSVLNGLACAREAGVPADAPRARRFRRARAPLPQHGQARSRGRRAGNGVRGGRPRPLPSVGNGDAAGFPARENPRRLSENSRRRAFRHGRRRGGAGGGNARRARGKFFAQPQNHRSRRPRLLRGAFTRRRGNAQRPIPTSRLTRPEQNFSAAARTSVTANADARLSGNGNAPHKASPTVCTK